MGLDVCYQSTERQLIAVDPQSADDSDRSIRQHRVPALGLTREDVRDVHLHEWQRDAGERVSQRQAGMRVRAGIDQGTLDATAHRMDAVDQRAFPILLGELELDLQLLRD